MIRIKVTRKALKKEKLNEDVVKAYYETANNKVHRLIKAIANRFSVRVRTGHLASLFNLHSSSTLFTPVSALDMRHLGGEKKFSPSGGYKSSHKGKRWVQGFSKALSAARGVDVRPNTSFKDSFTYKGSSSLSPALIAVSNAIGRGSYSFGPKRNTLVISIDGKEPELIKVIKSLITKRLFKEVTTAFNDKEYATYVSKL